ncbi:MAG: hypothetical protein ACJAX9_002943, partial [Celeribacter sp.]
GVLGLDVLCAAYAIGRGWDQATGATCSELGRVTIFCEVGEGGRRRGLF